ncbi:NAD-dependent epimerase/dehydratase family protein [Bdellovibrio sp. HCB274]|uniref:NAD-dependent epimerase/dehydratase family protein n=1 Tax=Bdellovibrio sp. HCB274 TaxID=3394361 RepID=UPI0039B49609
MDNQKVLLLGASGLIGAALSKKLSPESARSLLTPNSGELNLLNFSEVEKYFSKHKPEVVINAAGKSGGVAANIKMPADYSLENTLMSSAVISASLKSGVKRMIQFVPACVYPLNAPLPYNESSLLNGQVEESSKHFALAKLNALSMAEAMNKQHGTEFISVIPSNVYGPLQKKASEHSHVIPSLIKKMSEAKASQLTKVEIWGDGANQRDFLHSFDLADATLHLLEQKNLPSVINVASGEVTSIATLAKLIQAQTRFTGELDFVSNNLTGAQHKFLDTTAMDRFGWKAKIPLSQGLRTLQS